MTHMQLIYDGNSIINLSDRQIERIFNTVYFSNTPKENERWYPNGDFEELKNYCEDFFEEIAQFLDNHLKIFAVETTNSLSSDLLRKLLLCDDSFGDVRYALLSKPKLFCCLSAKEIIEVVAEQSYLIGSFKHFVNFHSESSILIAHYQKHSDPAIREYFFQYLDLEKNWDKENIQLIYDNKVIRVERETLKNILEELVVDLSTENHHKFINALVNSSNPHVRELIASCKDLLSDVFIKKLALDPCYTVRQILLEHSKTMECLSAEDVIESIAGQVHILRNSALNEHPELERLVAYYQTHSNRFIREEIKKFKH